MKHSALLAALILLSLVSCTTLVGCRDTKPNLDAEVAKQNALNDVSRYRNMAGMRIKSVKADFAGFEGKEASLRAIEKS